MPSASSKKSPAATQGAAAKLPLQEPSEAAIENGAERLKRKRWIGISIGALAASIVLIVVISLTVSGIAAGDKLKKDHEALLADVQRSISAANFTITSNGVYPDAEKDYQSIQSAIATLNALLAAGSDEAIKTAKENLAAATIASTKHLQDAVNEANVFAQNQAQEVVGQCTSYAGDSWYFLFIRFEGSDRIYGFSPTTNPLESVSTIRAYPYGGSWVLAQQGDPVVPGQLGEDPESGLTVDCYGMQLSG
jgi:hypothetical protein